MVWTRDGNGIGRTWTVADTVLYGMDMLLYGKDDERDTTDKVRMGRAGFVTDGHDSRCMETMTNLDPLLFYDTPTLIPDHLHMGQIFSVYGYYTQEMLQNALFITKNTM